MTTDHRMDEGLTIEPREIHVRSLRFEQASLDAASVQRLLSSTELDRADRFHASRDRDRYVLSRGWLRVLLAGYLRCAPDTIEIVTTTAGKPILGQAADQLHFSVSHTEHLIAYAFSKDDAVGIDIEAVDNCIDCAGMTGIALERGERDWLMSRPVDERPTAFAQMWTRKEALLKADGSGLGVDPRHVVVRHAGGWNDEVVVSGHPFCVQELYFDEDHAAALAWRSPVTPRIVIGNSITRDEVRRPETYGVAPSTT